MGLTEADDAPAETQDEPVNGLVEESLDVNDNDNVVKEVNEEQLVDNPYEEDILDVKDEEDPDVGQFSMLCFTDINDEFDCNAHFRSMTFIDPTDDNYTIKLASAQRAKKTPLTRGNSCRTGVMV